MAGNISTKNHSHARKTIYTDTTNQTTFLTDSLKYDKQD